MNKELQLHDAVTGLPYSVTSVAVDMWQDEDGFYNVIIWDQTGCSPNDGQRGTELFYVNEYEYDFRGDIENALAVAGFTILGSEHGPEWLYYDLPEVAGLLLTATR